MPAFADTGLPIAAARPATGEADICRKLEPRPKKHRAEKLRHVIEPVFASGMHIFAFVDVCDTLRKSVIDKCPKQTEAQQG